MSTIQENELKLWGFETILARRGILFTLYLVLIVAVGGLFAIMDRNDDRHREQLEKVNKDHKEEMASIHAELNKCKDNMAATIKEMDERQLTMLKELYSANAKLNYQIDQLRSRNR